MRPSDREQFYVVSFAVARSIEFCPHVRDAEGTDPRCQYCELHNACAFVSTLLHHLERVLNLDADALDTMINECCADVHDFRTLWEALET